MKTLFTIFLLTFTPLTFATTIWNSDGSYADIRGNTIWRSDGSYSDIRGNTIWNSDGTYSTIN